MGREQEEPTVGEILDGVSLWDEHRPQSGEDWVAVAGRFLADGADTEDSSPLFAGLVLAVAERDRLREALRLIVGDDPPFADFQFAGLAEDREKAMIELARSALSPESNPEGER